MHLGGWAVRFGSINRTRIYFVRSKPGRLMTIYITTLPSIIVGNTLFKIDLLNFKLALLLVDLQDVAFTPLPYNEWPYR